ncbi:MAG: translation elongation factor Ts [Candidatus Nanosyncoccaceae bacterium]|jgi:elongation factor Ts
MAKFTAEDIKKLKDLTGVGLTDAREALREANGDFDKALKAMREKGMTKAEKRGDRETRSGIIDSYIHDGRIGVLVEINCETDFVARTEEFKALAHEIALQVAGMNPAYVSREAVPAEEVERVKAEIIAANGDKLDKKPKEIVDKIVQGQVDKHFDELILLNQVYFKDTTKTIEDLVKETIAKLGENITVRRFARMEVGLDV